jgi:4-amino-4-deoxy-L-arabinose transferase-like glycosyltransferase
LAGLHWLSGRPNRWSPSAAISILAVLTGVVYLWGLSSAPIHLHYDEVLFAEQARSIAATGGDLNGRWLPVYFQMDATIWFHPIGVYLPALAFLVAPVSVEALRAPAALVGVLDVVLVTLIALRIFKRLDLAVLAGLLLATTPAHFIHSRMAVDYLFPTPFALAWCLLLLRCIETRAMPALFAATSVLGLGIYSYIAAVVLMPLLLAFTLVLLLLERFPSRAVAVALAGFLWPLVPAALFVLTHPEMLGSTLGRYGVELGQLDAFQRVRETLTPWFVSDRANLYLSFFSPGYLFVTGGGSLVGSTRSAGVFLAALVVPLIVGFRAALIRYSPANLVMLAGFLLPAAAGSVVAEQFAVSRAIAMLPFAILLATLGIEQFRGAGSAQPAGGALRNLGIAGMVVAGVYAVYRMGQGNASTGSVIAIVACAALIAVGYLVRRNGRLWPVAIALLGLCALQFVLFTRDYFGDYRARSAFWFNGNLSGAVSKLVELADARPGGPPAVVMDDGIQRVDWYWRFHLAELGRSELAGQLRVMQQSAMEASQLQPGTLVLVPAQNAAERGRFEANGLALAAVVSDPNDEYSGMGPGEHPAYLIYQRR